MSVSSSDFYMSLFLSELTPEQKDAIDRIAEVLDQKGHPYMLLLIAAMLFYADRSRYDGAGAPVVKIPAHTIFDDDIGIADDVEMPDGGDVARAALSRLWPEWQEVLAS